MYGEKGSNSAPGISRRNTWGVGVVQDGCVVWVCSWVLSYVILGWFLYHIVRYLHLLGIYICNIIIHGIRAYSLLLIALELSTFPGPYCPRVIYVSRFVVLYKS